MNKHEGLAAPIDKRGEQPSENKTPEAKINKEILLEVFNTRFKAGVSYSS